MSEPSDLSKSAPAAGPAGRRRSIPARLFAFFGSFGLAVVVLSFLLLLTWLGTISQVDMSLYDVQKKYFDSWFLLQEVGPIKVPLPGAFLLMAILLVNLTIGGLVRLRKGWRTAGVAVSHFSMLFLLVAGAVSFYFKREGYLKLHEGQSGNRFTSFHDRVIEIAEVGKDGPVLMIHEADFQDLKGGDRSRTFHAASLPFELVVTQYAKNCEAESDAMRPAPAGVRVADGFYLRPQPDAMSAETNFAGVTAVVKEPGGAEKPILLWELATAPVTHRTADGRAFTIALRRQSWELPFSITLNKFTHEKHPGTNTPKVFASDVLKRDPDISQPQPIKIEMNKPLRHEGYTLFQQSYNDRWTPDRPRSEMYSVFAVVSNPSDQWPVWATIMAAVGMTVHFGIKLAGAINRSSKKSASSSPSAAA